MKSKDYWILRALQREENAYRSTTDTLHRLRSIYDLSSARLVRVVKNVLRNFMKSSGVTDEQEAKQLLTVQETADTLAALRKEYADTGDPDILARLNAPAYAYRISRAQAIRKAIDAETEWMNEKELQAGAQRLVETVDNAYYQTMYDAAKESDKGINFAPLSSRDVTEALENKWKGENYSDRVWKNTHLVASEAGKIIDAGLTSGASVQQMSHDIMDLFDVAYYAAARLVRTEMNRMHNDATIKSYKTMDVEWYTFLATLDARTCSVCGALDMQHFKVSEARTGENLPPMHPNDRCTTIAYYPDEESSGTRIARDPETGKNYKVDRNLSYEDWRKEVAEKYGADTLEKAQKKYINYSSDKKQYDNYRKVLGNKYVSFSFPKFQEEKYKNTTEWGIIKAQYRAMSFYNKAIQNEPSVTKVVTDIAKQMKMEPAGLEYRIKSKDSYLRKVRSNYQPSGNDYEVKDILRYTYTAGSEELVDKTLNCIDGFEKDGYNTITVKNYWLNKNNPYNGINTIIKAPNGQKFELQYHTPESFELKNGKLHKLYEKARLIEDETSPEFLKLRDEMFDLSDKLTAPDGIERVNNK